MPGNLSRMRSWKKEMSISPLSYRYWQLSSVFALYALCVWHSRYKVKDRHCKPDGDRVKSRVVMMAAVYVLKNTTHQLRPDGSAYTSFPSGIQHRRSWAPLFFPKNTKTAINGCARLRRSFIMGIMRMANNRHYISDVLVGAGIGILSTKVIYWTHPPNGAGKIKRSSAIKLILTMPVSSV